MTTTSAKSAAIDPTAVVPENDPADVLTSVPLFSGLSDDEVDRIASLCKARRWEEAMQERAALLGGSLRFNDEVLRGLCITRVRVTPARIDEAMGGWPIAQIRTPTGFAFTLYRSPEHPFIHALSTTEGWALCIDLPATGAGDAAGSLDWGIAAATDGRTIVAANATLGLVASFYDGDYTPRTASFAPTAASGIVLAKSGDDVAGGAGHRVVTAADGSIYAAGATGVVRLSGSDLTVTGRFVSGSPVDAIALSPDGSTLYALIRSGGRIVAVDVASGRMVGEVPGYGFDRLVAVFPG